MWNFRPSLSKPPSVSPVSLMLAAERIDARKHPAQFSILSLYLEWCETPRESEITHFIAKTCDETYLSTPWNLMVSTPRPGFTRIAYSRSTGPFIFILDGSSIAEVEVRSFSVDACFVELPTEKWESLERGDLTYLHSTVAAADLVLSLEAWLLMNDIAWTRAEETTPLTFDANSFAIRQNLDGLAGARIQYPHLVEFDVPHPHINHRVSIGPNTASFKIRNGNVVWVGEGAKISGWASQLRGYLSKARSAMVAPA